MQVAKIETMVIKKSTTDVAITFVVPLIIISAILAGTIFQFLLHLSEIFLLLVLLIGILPYKLLRREQVLLIVFLFSQVGSFFINELPIFLLNAKQFGIAVLSIIYFRRNAKRTKFLNVTVVVCSLLVFYEFFIGSFPINIAPLLSTMKDSLGTRPLGIFLNYHFTSFFLSIFFIGYSVKKRLFFLDYILLWSISVKTNFLAYLSQKIFGFLQKRLTFLKSSVSVIILLIILALFLLTSLALILEKFQEFDYGYNSAYVILNQIVDPKSYLEAIYIFPHDVVRFLNEEALFDFPELTNAGFVNHGSELSIVRILVQGGVFLAISFLFSIFKSFTKFRLFILISLFHYSFILSPLIIYIMSVFEFEDIEIVR